MHSKMILLAAVIGMLLMAGCNQGEPNPTALPAGEQAAVPMFTPYASTTPRASASPTPPGTATPLPSPSPTPRQHSVARGEDMGGIAFRYGITLEALIAANPNVSPNTMSIGTVLLIPGSDRPAAGQPTSVPSLTPVPLVVGVVHCAATGEGGAWCFLPVRNTSDVALENLSAVLRLADSANGQIISQTGLPPLDYLPPGAEMPLLAYFPAPVPAAFTAGGELLTAMPVAGSNRYVDAHITEPRVTVAVDGLSAQVGGSVSLADPQSTAEQVWVAAVAYDRTGNVAGVRRWESAEPLTAGSQVAFDFAVYSTGAPIERVGFLVQARP